MTSHDSRPANASADARAVSHRTADTSASRVKVGTMDRVQKRIIKRALRRHKHIYPCASKTSLGECFTSCKDRLVLWYNTADKTTHAISDRD
jgi:hypothetical protein